MLDSGRWGDLTSPELTRLDPESTVALLPVAAIEQHGPHLPVGTDALINAGIVAGALARLQSEEDADDTGPRRARLLVLPALDVGHSIEHADYAGTLTAGAETLLALWTDVAGGVAASGVRKLILFNSHGGQTGLMDLAAVRWRRQLGLMVARASWPDLGMPAGLFGDSEVTHGLHGGEIETSLMLHLHPQLVRRPLPASDLGPGPRLAERNAVLGLEQPVGIGWLAQDLGPDGICGAAARADAERGARLLEHLVDRLATLARELAATPLTLLAPAPQHTGSRD
jgi:creatinine amidohydrolase